MPVSMKPTPLSSNIEAIGHDAEKGELHVQFKGGKRYVYEDVPAELHDRMAAAESAGRFHYAHIKGKYRHRTAE